jgi:homoprotocatechuate degradation regulator HpaR
MMMYRTLDAGMPPFRHIFSRFGLTEQQWRVLRVLWENDAQPLLSLSHATLISPPSLVGIVDRLTRDGLVERVRSKTDRRVVNVCVTKHGRALEHKVTPLISKTYDELENRLDADEWRDLYRILDELIGDG